MLGYYFVPILIKLMNGFKKYTLGHQPKMVYASNSLSFALNFIYIRPGSAVVDKKLGLYLNRDFLIIIKINHVP